MRRTKATKVLATILCQCMILGTISMNVQAAEVSNNAAGNTVNEIENLDTMNENAGTVISNSGTVITNYGTVNQNVYLKGIVETNAIGGIVTINDGTVTTNYGTVTTNNGTVANNYGTVQGYYGTVTNNYGTAENNPGGGNNIKNDYRTVEITGTNSDKITTEGVSTAPDTAPDIFKQKKYVLIKSSTVSSGTIKLTPIAGYHFVSEPTVSPDCTEVTNGSYYKYINITGAITITVDVAADTPNPAPTPSPNDNNDRNETVPALNPYEKFVQTQITNIKNAKEDSTVVIESEDCNSYSFNFMKEILNKRDVTVKMVYNYKGEHYEVIIPKNEMFMLDDKISWYGPLKLEQMFGAVKTPLIK